MKTGLVFLYTGAAILCLLITTFVVSAIVYTFALADTLQRIVLSIALVSAACMAVGVAIISWAEDEE